MREHYGNLSYGDGLSDLVKLAKAQKAVLCEINKNTNKNQSSIFQVCLTNDNGLTIKQGIQVINFENNTLTSKLFIDNNEVTNYEIISCNNKTVLKDEICLPNGTILLRYNTVNIETSTILNSSYYNLDNTPYLGDLTQLSDMICCCNKSTSIYVEETFTPLQGTNIIQLSTNAIDFTKPIEVERNGLDLDPTEYSINGNIITFDVTFDASTGAEYNEIIIVKFYKLN